MSAWAKFQTQAVSWIAESVYLTVKLGFPGGSVVKNLPAKQERWVWSLGWENPLEKEMATNSSSYLGNPMDREA